MSTGRRQAHCERRLRGQYLRDREVAVTFAAAGRKSPCSAVEVAGASIGGVSGIAADPSGDQRPPSTRFGRELPCPRPGLDLESRSWWERLHASEPERGAAIAELHERLRREAAFHIRLRVRALPRFPRSDIGDLATQAADDSLIALLRKLEDYRGDSQFWTWARRFAALEAPVSIRRRLGHDHVGISREPEHALRVHDPAGSSSDRQERQQQLRDVIDLMADELTPRQRRVMIATAINGESAQVLAVELGTTPGAIYKTLHDARRKLRTQLAP